jgi:hypothetical protein
MIRALLERDDRCVRFDADRSTPRHLQPRFLNATDVAHTKRG